MSSKMAEIAGCILWNHMGFLLYTALKKMDLFFLNGKTFVCLCSGNRIHQSMLSRPLLAGSDNTNLNII